MSLEQAIHSRWAGDGALAGLVPAARFVTGKALGGEALPYATLSRIGSGKTTRSSLRLVEEVLCRFDVWSSSLDTLKQVADAAAARFDGQSFTDAGVTVLRMRRTEQKETQADDGTWRLTMDFTAKLEK
jgi:hypothetical protein